MKTKERILDEQQRSIPVPGYYEIAIANQVNGSTITHFKIGIDGEERTPGHTIKYNCGSNNCIVCALQGKYDPLFLTDCNDEDLEVYIYAEFNNGTPNGWFGPFKPDPVCNEEGEVFCFDGSNRV